MVWYDGRSNAWKIQLLFYTEKSWFLLNKTIHYSFNSHKTRLLTVLLTCTIYDSQVLNSLLIGFTTTNSMSIDDRPFSFREDLYELLRPSTLALAFQSTNWSYGINTTLIWISLKPWTSVWKYSFRLWIWYLLF